MNTRTLKLILKKRSLLPTSLIVSSLSFFLIGCGNANTGSENITSAQTKTTSQVSDLASITQKRLSVPLKIATDLPHYLTRNVQDDVFYFVMPDRFNNGNTDNDNGSKTLAISAGGFDKTNKAMYHGGDIQGLQQKLPYLKSLGISAIWLTPILRNQAMQADSAGYHGYWVLDFTEIDPHLGTNDDLKSLIEAAHQDNIKIFFDIITNHTADVIKYPTCHGADGLQWLVAEGKDCPYKSLEQIKNGEGYQAIIPKGQENLKVPAWLNDPKHYHNQGDSTWQGESSVYGDFSGLDDIDTNSADVVTGMTDIFKNLISEFKPDGFRIDTVKHVNTEFWTEFSPALVEHAKSIGIPEFFMFGEVYSGDSKELSVYTTKGKMQSVLDFGFAFTLQNTLVDQQGTDKFAELFANDKNYLDEDSNANQLLNFTGNHDMGRFAHMLSQSDKGYDEHEIIQRNLLAHAMAYFMRGMPIIYYGDEQGFVGDGGDQDARQDMMPSMVKSYNDDDLLASDTNTATDNFNSNHPFYKIFAEYAHIYHQYPALRYGQHKTLYAQKTPGIYALSRTITKDDAKQVVVFNTATSEQEVVLDINNVKITEIYKGSGTGHAMSLIKNKATIKIPALSFAIYQVN
jgi:glycosidase